MATTNPALKSGSKYADLKRRLWFLLGALVVYRIGTHIPVPGINANVLDELFRNQQGGILGLFNVFSGGALEKAVKLTGIGATKGAKAAIEAAGGSVA